MAKKKNDLTLEEKLKNALVPEEEQPYPIPDNWIWTRLGEIIFIYRGVSYKKTDIHSVKSNDDCLILRGGNIEEGGIVTDFSDNVYVDKSLIKGHQFLKTNDVIIVSSTGSSKVIGRAGISENDYDDVSFGAFLTLVRTNNIMNKRYISYFFQSDLYRQRIRSLASGININNIKNDHIKEIIIPLPPFQEQQRIVERIESLFSKLDKAKEKIQLALDSFENRKSAILYQAFSGELTKKWREENGISLDDWNKGTLQTVCSMKITDGTHQTPKYTIKEEGIPFLSAKDIVTEKIKWDKIKYITKELHEQLYKRVKPQKGDVLLAKNGTTGVAAIVEDEKVFDIYVTLALLRADDKKIFSRFLYYLVNSPLCKEQFNSKLTGIGVPNLHLRDIRNVEIEYPSLEEQKEIVRILDIIFEKEQDTEELIGLIEKIDLMKKSILARAFRGELGTNIPEEESAIELLKSVLEAEQLV